MSDQDKNPQDGTDTGNASDNSDQHQEKTVPYARFTQVNDQKKAAEATLQTIVDDLIDDVPEDFRDLIPEQLSPADKISWIRKATKANLFKQQASSSGPDSQRPRSKPDIDLTNMSPQQLIKAGYKQ